MLMVLQPPSPFVPDTKQTTAPNAKCETRNERFPVMQNKYARIQTRTTILHEEPATQEWRRRTMRTLRQIGRYAGLCLALWLCTSLTTPSVAEGRSLAKLRRRCARLFRYPLFLKAASCYSRLYRKSKSSDDLWYIAESYRLAAENQRSPSQGIILRRRAIYYYNLHKKKAGPSKRAKQIVRKLRAEVWAAEKKGYAYVTVEERDNSGKVYYTLRRKGRIVGSGRLPIREDLRPGRYTLILRRRGHHPQKITLIIRKDKPIYVRHRMRKKSEPKPKPIEKQSGSRSGPLPAAGGDGGDGGDGGGGVPTIVPWVVLGGAVVCTLIGGIFVAVAAGNHAGIKAAPEANQATKLFNDMGWLLPAGAVFVFVGVAGQVGAGVLFYFAYARRDG